LRDLLSLFEKPRDPLSFSAIKISLASPQICYRLSPLFALARGHTTSKAAFGQTR